jgi:hypothetical protein
MAKAQVVILSGKSLFAEGIASRLKEFPQRVEISILDPREGDTISRVGRDHPAAVIIDASEPKTDTYCLLCELLINNPGLKVIRLDPEQSVVQIVTSTHLKASDVSDLVELI